MPADQARDAYFLTRHHAHLLEALEQAVKQPASVSVIHGETGLGKSRLLRAFIAHRCRDRSCRFIRFLPQGLVQLEAEGSDTPPFPQHELQTALHRVTGSDAVWLVDQFELALPHGREQLYAAWRDAGRPALILAGQLSWPEAWRDLLPQQAGELHAAAVQPLDEEESRDYLDRLVCRQPGQGLRRNARLRRIIRDCRGRIPLLQDAADSLDLTECIAIEPGISPVPGRVVALILLAALLAYAGYRYWPPAQTPSVAIAPVPDPAVAPQTVPDPEPAPEPEKPAVTEPVAIAHQAEPVAVAPVAPLPEHRPETETEESPDRPVPVMAPQEETSVDVFAEFAAWPLLHERLQATRDWLLDNRSQGEWSIQLMTLSLGEPAARSLQAHLERLAGRGIALDSLWVYRAPAKPGRAGHFGLLYGRYPSRDDAARASRKLPDALRVKRPLLRSVESLRRNSEAVLSD